MIISKEDLATIFLHIYLKVYEKGNMITSKIT